MFLAACVALYMDLKPMLAFLGEKSCVTLACPWIRKKENLNTASLIMANMFIQRKHFRR